MKLQSIVTVGTNQRTHGMQLKSEAWRLSHDEITAVEQHGKKFLRDAELNEMFLQLRPSENKPLSVEIAPRRASRTNLITGRVQKQTFPFLFFQRLQSCELQVQMEIRHNFKLHANSKR